MSLVGQQNRPVAAGGGLALDRAEPLGQFQRPFVPGQGRLRIATQSFDLAQRVQHLHLALVVAGTLERGQAFAERVGRLVEPVAVRGQIAQRLPEYPGQFVVARGFGGRQRLPIPLLGLGLAAHGVQDLGDAAFAAGHGGLVVSLTV